VNVKRVAENLVTTIFTSKKKNYLNYTIYNTYVGNTEDLSIHIEEMTD